MKIFRWWKKPVVENPRLCPECNAVVPEEDSHRHADLAICRRCNKVFRPSECEIPGGAEAVARNRGLLRIRMSQRGDETRICWFSGLRGLIKAVSRLNTLLLSGTLALAILFGIVMGFGSWKDILAGTTVTLIFCLGLEAAAAILVLPVMLLIASSKIVLKPGEDGFHTGTYYRTRFFRTHQFPIDADSRVFLTLQPAQPIAQFGPTSTPQTLLTVRTDTIDSSFGPSIPEQEKKILAMYLWQYIRTLKTVRGIVTRHPDTNERLRCPICDSSIPLVDAYPAEDILVCDHCNAERPFPPDPDELQLDEVLVEDPPPNLRIHNRSYGLWIRYGSWPRSIGYGLQVTVFTLLTGILIVSGSVFLIMGMVRTVKQKILKAQRWTVVLRLPTEDKSGQIVVSNSHWFRSRKIHWDPATRVSLQSCYPSIRGTELPMEICIRTDGQELRFGREIDPEQRRYMAAILRAAVKN